MESLKVLLVANRGEIACRLIKSAQKLGIKTIAIYSESDGASQHVLLADKACLLAGEARSAYIDGDQIIKLALENGAQGVIPGYGFLSENADFCRSANAAGVVFVGPSPEAIEAFGLKHTARDLAVKAGVPVVPGSKGLLETEDAAVEQTESIGYPVMLKATAGGGGMGLMVCNTEDDLRKNFQTVKSRGGALFKNSGVFLERYYAVSHHIEVQIFGNGLGKAISVGERECSIQRRHQKVVEECPSPFVTQMYPGLRKTLTECAVRLAESINYASAGTIEYLVDHETGEFFFLEMNTRLQVEHGITELCYNIDLVELMLRQADAQLSGYGGLPNSELGSLQKRLLEPKGHAIEVRVYAENPVRNYAPSPGLLQEVKWHELPGTRIDTWIRAGQSITPEYDPLLAKVMQHAGTREEAIAGMDTVLSNSTICGPPVNLDFLLSIIRSPDFRSGFTSTKFLTTHVYAPAAIDVISGGSYTLVQDFPGRPTVGRGFGHCGPMDPIAFQSANILVGNKVGTEGLEITLRGPELLFLSGAVVALCGPQVSATLDGKEIPLWQRLEIFAGQKLAIGAIETGCRAYLAVYGGFPNVSTWCGSKATCPMVQVGGYQGRALRPGDLLHIVSESKLPKSPTTAIQPVPEKARPRYSHQWIIQAMPGPYETGYISKKDIDMLYSHSWKISHNAARGGIRLIGPRPEYARSHGGDGGAHPSNVIEYGYPIGGLNWTGDEPVIFPVDCPDFGGFICSLTVVTSDWWKVGQIRMGDEIRFCRTSLERALRCARMNSAFLENMSQYAKSGSWGDAPGFDNSDPISEAYVIGADVIKVLEETATRPRVTYRAGGDSFLLVDYGFGKADLNMKCRATALKRALEARGGLCSTKTKGGAILNMVGCGNSLCIYYESLRLSRDDLMTGLLEIEDALGSMAEAKLPNRTFKLPAVFKHKKLEDAIQRYMVNQRPSASYLPDPLKFVAENNGMTVDELKQLFLTVETVVIGVGFFLALPQTLPSDPRHRISCPKMNPSRTFTPEGTFSWGGTAIAIYATDSPGGYMPTGMTIPGVDIFGHKAGFTSDRPWLFEDMDVITFYEITTEEYDAKMLQFKAGTYQFEYTESFFDVGAHNKLLADTKEEVKLLNAKRADAQSHMMVLEKELLAQWDQEKQAGAVSLDSVKSLLEDPNVIAIESPMQANVWKVIAEEGQLLQADQKITILEAMKMEIDVAVPERLIGATLDRILIKPGDTVESGQAVAIARLSGKD
ncbi:urea carboxylase [Exophiala xenobiotica]|uniref:Urea carboxylase n=1 Tax=Exophiala xenobiotica TaxID=348802 RepID=A0A0D2ECZ6_9EURO|nr:urea carboxylase [Exophiala xenobiotica]KIW52515.1 urea carboxylase [Exophiala xenobiotica]